MKNLALISLCIMSMCSISVAQKITIDKVPALVIKAFQSKFPDVKKSKWELEKGAEYEASFKINGVETSVNFDTLGNWIETETEIELSAIPKVIQVTLESRFADYKLNEASKIERAKDGTCYEIEASVNKKSFDILFDLNGAVISQKKTENGND